MPYAPSFLVVIRNRHGLGAIVHQLPHVFADAATASFVANAVQRQLDRQGIPFQAAPEPVGGLYKRRSRAEAPTLAGRPRTAVASS